MRSGLTFHRRCGMSVQVINVQLSQANVGEVGAFYINVGLNFDEIRALEGKPSLVKPKVYECQFQRRLERLVPGVPERWEVTRSSDADALALTLHVAFEHLLLCLDQIDSIHSFLARAWLKGGADFAFLAQCHYVQGNRQEAVAALQQLDDTFRTRPRWNLEDWLDRLGLRALESDLHM